MNKAELVKAMSEVSELSKKDSELALNALLKTIGTTLANGDSINMLGFGKFFISEKKERVAHNPRTMEKVVVPAKSVPKFKFSPMVVDAVKNA